MKVLVTRSPLLRHTAHRLFMRQVCAEIAEQEMEPDELREFLDGAEMQFEYWWRTGQVGPDGPFVVAEGEHRLISDRPDFP